MRRGAILISLFAALAMPGAAHAQGLDVTCQFALTRLDATTANVLAIDTNAVYWMAPLPAGTPVRVEGRQPHARYMSWNVYDALGRPIDSVNDDQLGDPYSFTFESPSPGTLWYRVYVPDPGRDEKGGVPLPRVIVGDGAPLPTEACRELQAPYLHAVNEAIAAAPGLPDPTADGDGYPGRNPPRWRLFQNLCTSAVDILLDNPDGEAFHEGAYGSCGDGPGFFSNRDIAYVFAPTSRGFGELLAVEARAPTLEQLRYWSLCQYEPATQRVIACLRDEQVPGERFTVVVSAADQRPANARPECGVAWLPWGPQTQGLLIYRHMLPDPSFAEAIQRVPAPGAERETMGEYFPESSYLPGKAAFEARGCPVAQG